MVRRRRCGCALRDVLTSPHFLYRIETRTDLEHPQADSPSTESELAARLASFLWNSAPDDELLQLAEAGRLRQELAAQTRRLLRDPRSRALVDDFAGAWLGLRQLDYMNHVPEALRRAMRQETEQFVACIMHEDRSVLEFLDADYTFLNEPLARHYGIAGVTGEPLRRVSLAGTMRGGLLTQASILTLTSPGDAISPVQRGKWILDNVLGTPPPAPRPACSTRSISLRTTPTAARCGGASPSIASSRAARTAIRGSTASVLPWPISTRTAPGGRWTTRNHPSRLSCPAAKSCTVCRS